jgi:hypothetical protein
LWFLPIATAIAEETPAMYSSDIWTFGVRVKTFRSTFVECVDGAGFYSYPKYSPMGLVFTLTLNIAGRAGWLFAAGSHKAVEEYRCTIQTDLPP